ncbi:hypothetical protein [Paracoccus sediminicola]|uniref:hypothetical protein n=1 Tax=Paracoccus sediminicola TaxID=3017783 RepID=UPI0022F08310|nr:hypothetical protein [Paracoccus sediminicola]WBU55702.1 hypothetical protein PAF18_09195 [Paracoccus sediminicola]
MTDYSDKSTRQIVDQIEDRRQSLLRNVDQLQGQFRPENLMETARTALLDSGGAEFTRNMGRSLRDNPLPVALIGAGMAWLIAGQGGPTSRDIASRGRDMSDRVSERFGNDDDDDDDYRGDRIGTRASGLYRPVGSSPAVGGRGISHDVQGRQLTEAEFADADDDDGESIADRARRSVDEARDRLSSARDNASRRGRDFARSARQSADDLRYSARDRFDRSRDQFADVAGTAADRVSEAYRSNPVVLGLGVAALAALGATLLPSTRREDELFGEQADELKDRSREVLDTTVERAGEIAEKTLDSAKSEAEARGYDTGNAEKAASGVIDDLSEIGAKAAETAKKEIDADVNKTTSTGSGASGSSDGVNNNS